MPRRNNFRKRVRARKYVRKFNRKARAGMGQNGKRFFKLKGAFGLSSDVSGTINMSVTDDVSGLGDWSSIAALFDTYKVCALKVKFFPQLPNDPSGTTGYFPSIALVILTARLRLLILSLRPVNLRI